MDLDDILSSRMPGYEPRLEQKRMAEAVGDALQGGGQLIVEAGTGTGKSLAYLIPLIEYVLGTGKRAVVSTYTKALQRQLVEKELPFLKSGVYGDLRYCLCLGSENYLCLRRLGQARKYGLFSEAASEVDGLLRWSSRTETGLRGDLPRSVTVGWGLWQKVSRQSDLCHGRACRFYDRCHYQKARAAERQSHLLVVNHHLFFANVASALKVLPPFEAAVFDEAHELEDVAASYLGLEISDFKTRHILDSILSPQGRGLLSRLKWLEPGDFSNMSSLVAAARAASEGFFGALSGRLGGQSLRIREKDFLQDTLSEPLLALSEELLALRGASADDEEKKDITALCLRLAGTAKSLSEVLGQGLPGHVYWAGRAGRSVTLQATPIDIGDMGVFEFLEASVFTSATLSAGGTFSYMKERLGLRGAAELLLRSPFDFRRQALLYIAEDLAEPGTPEFEAAVIARIGELLEITGGRTLVLFTSHGLLARAAEATEVEGIEVLVQGDADSYLLIEEFKRNGRSVVFGTHTFWQGIDVPGEALECVVITKLPFAVPDEPVIEARMEALERLGRNPFAHYQIPQAAILLKQGFGRLIRRATDRGVVAMLDRRISTRHYGREFLKSLPECKITGAMEDVRTFLKGRPDGRRPSESAPSGREAKKEAL
jgi:ATP-dependent DNA helicase DinG